ncbi:MAG: LamB/YcsF family protein [Clostridia bacterium]|nr:LamB/YcsF family protein [Clostridia bacterium]
MYSIDLNSDLGESFGAYKMGRDADIIPLVSSANVACGFHAGDPTIMAKTAKLCKESGAAIGAHPGFNDIVGFGRRNMNVSPEDAKNMIVYQVGALDAFCKSVGIKLQHVKPHGALYNMAAKDSALAKAICEGIYEYDSSLILLGLANSEMIAQAKQIGLPYAQEVFADRAYEDDGTLVARTKPGSMIKDEDEAVSRVIGMIKNRTVKSINGNEIEICPDSVCVHGDSEKALLFVKKIRDALTKEGIAIAPIHKIISER